ncbi:unnamed protein product, partial [Pocillopora meandrina]
RELLEAYGDATKPGSLEGVSRFARIHLVYTYKVKEMDDTPVRGTFYEQDLQKVQIPDDALYRIEKVLKRQGNKVLVSWKGFPPKHNSWLNKKDIQKL